MLQIASPDAIRRIQRVQTVTIACGGWSRVVLLRILLAMFALPSHAQSKPLQEPNQTSAIDQMFSQEFAKDRAGAVTVGLLKEGQLVWTTSYGVLDQRHKLPATESTVYGIASVTKMFAGIMLLQLVERGKVHFTDTVEKYFPEVNLIPKKYSWAPPITLVQVATMSAGLQATSSSVGDLTPLAHHPIGRSS